VDIIIGVLRLDGGMMGIPSLPGIKICLRGNNPLIIVVFFTLFWFLSFGCFGGI
jgi:hypothetical protein